MVSLFEGNPYQKFPGSPAGNLGMTTGGLLDRYCSKLSCEESVNPVNFK
jgi:hypothetical protein